MTDKKDLIREIHEYATTHGGENTATHLLVQAASAIQTQAAELEAVGAGGVSGPLMGRASLSANAGDPVAWQYRSLPDVGGVWFDCTKERADLRAARPEIWEVRALYAAPPTAQAEGWTKLPGQLPEPGMPVLLDIGKKYPIRAMWAAKHTVQAADDDTDWGEYVEADDMYYAPEGWYEWNQCEENHWRVTETPRAWMPLPPTSAEGWSMGERSNPNNCASCRHKQNPDGGHCYMFRFEPTEMCAQHTSQIHALQALRMQFGRWGTPQPVVREPLTDEQLAEMMRDTWGCASIAPRHALEFARTVERAHGIAQKGGAAALDCHHRPPCDECAAIAAQGCK